MEEPFGGVMTMGERFDHPQVLGSTGSEPRADPGAGVPFRRVGRRCKQAPDAGWERSGTGEAAGEGDGV